MDEVAVLIPCYNEAGTIGGVVKEFRKALPQAVIYVYDNNSTDGTDQKAREAGAVVRYEGRQGKGAVIRSMFRDIDARCYLMIDGDATYSAEKAPEMVALVLERGADMVVGDRLSSTYFTENKRRFHNSGNRAVRGLINLLFHNHVPDIMTGYRAFGYVFVKTFPVLSRGFEIETEMTIHALDKDMKIEHVVVDYRDRPDGSQSKLDTVSDGTKVIKTIFKLFKNYRPMLFFGTLSMLLFILAGAFFLPVLLEYIKTGLVPKFPTLIVSGFAAIGGLQAYFSGLILNVLKAQNRQQFELTVNHWKNEYHKKTGGEAVEKEEIYGR